MSQNKQLHLCESHDCSEHCDYVTILYERYDTMDGVLLTYIIVLHSALNLLPAGLGTLTTR